MNNECYDSPEFRENVLNSFKEEIQYENITNLVGIIVDWDEEWISGICLFDGDVTEFEKEAVSDLEAEVIAHFLDHKIDLVAKSSDEPLSADLLTNGTWVFRRGE